MAQFASMFKAEVARVARKETRKLTQASTALVRELRLQQRQHRAEIESLQRELRAVIKFVRGLRPATAEGTAGADTAAKSRERVTAKGLIAMRKRTGLSAADYGRLVGVTGQTIYAWEQGKSEPREGQKAAILKMRGVGRRAALAALGQLEEATPKAQPRKGGRPTAKLAPRRRRAKA
ncbi:MAG: helix-turn-helix domain-containing protein [Burkholderiales bacterium]